MGDVGEFALQALREYELAIASGEVADPTEVARWFEFRDAMNTLTDAMRWD